MDFRKAEEIQRKTHTDLRWTQSHANFSLPKISG